MHPLVLLTACVLLMDSTVQAQSISIVNMDGSREAILLEATLNRLLRANGYTVQGAGTKGYVVLLHGMSAHTKQGTSIGVVGSATVARVLRRESAAALLPEGSPEGQEFVEQFTALMGSPVIYLASTTAVGGDTEAVAEILSIYVTTAIRHSSRMTQELLQILDKRDREPEPTPLPEAGR